MHIAHFHPPRLLGVILLAAPLAVVISLVFVSAVKDLVEAGLVAQPVLPVAWPADHSAWNG